MTISGAEAKAREAEQGTEHAEHRVRAFVDHPLVTRLARAGYVTKGLIYLLVAGLAGKVAIGAKGETTDQSGALTAVAGQAGGRVALVALGIGLVLYGSWNAVQAFINTQGDDRGPMRVTERIGYGVLSMTYYGLAISALRLVVGERRAPTSDDSAHDLTAQLVGHGWGIALVVVAALVMLGLTVFFLSQTVMARFRNTLDYTRHPHIPVWVVALGRVGFAALGVVNGTVGVLLLNAMWRHDANEAKGLGGALSALLARPHGPTTLGIVAAGLSAYGLYSFAEAHYRNLNRRQ